MNRVFLRRILLAAIDCLLCAAAFLFSGALWNISLSQPWQVWLDIPWAQLLLVVAVNLVALSLGGVYNVLWSLAGVAEGLRMVVLEGVACVVAVCANLALAWGMPPAMLVLTYTLTLAMVISARFIWRMLCSGRFQFRERKRDHPVMVVGAGEAGMYVISHHLKDQNRPAQTIILVDDDPYKQRQRVYGVLVRGTSKDIPALVDRYGVQEIIIAIPSLKGEAFSNLVALCNSTKCRIRILSTLEDGKKADADAGGQEPMHLRELNVSDFLARDEIRLHTDSIREYLTGKSVLVTGGGGSIGSEICRQVMRFSPRELCIYDIYENSAYELLVELRRLYDQRIPIRVIIGSVRDEARLEMVFAEAKPDVVFHAAAHKHVSLMEKSPCEAIKNNVRGTYNTLMAASRHGVDRFVLLSTDKAVNPVNVMGASKRVCEYLVQMFAKKTEMKCMAVRFGNVLGSHGSVIPLFEAQIKGGGPVTITDPNITRFFMTIPEASQLVLQAGGMAESGSIYILNMGEPVRILDLATKMIRFYGYVPDKDIELRYTGLRTGEKLHEELTTRSESAVMRGTSHGMISVVPPQPFDDEAFTQCLTRMFYAAEQNDPDIRTYLVQAVETYVPLETA